MKSFLLLILSLMAGCVASDTVKGCQGGWVEFTCGYKKNNYRKIVVEIPKESSIEITQGDVWQPEGNIFLYHDTTNKKIRVAIKQLQSKGFGEYKCKFYLKENGDEDGDDDDDEKQEENTVIVGTETDGCQGQFIQTAYKTAKTTITCNYPQNRDESNVLFFCKENKITCEDILSTESSPKSNGTFTLTETNRGFNVSISEVSSHHAGVYWYGVKSNEGSYRAGFRKIQLEVKNITHFTMSLTIGQNFTYWCDYPNGTPIKKFICKGEDPSICEPLVNTMQLNKNTGRFSMKDNNKKRNITITVREVTTDDTGTYWCGAKSTDDKHSNPFFHRFSMTVAQSTTTSTSAENNGAPWGIITVTARVAVLVLVPFVLILFFIYKRFSQSKNTRNAAAAQNIREDNDYEGAEEHVQKENSGSTTASCSTDPSAPQHYAAIDFPNHSGKAGGTEALILKPSSSACEYSTVKNI